VGAVPERRTSAVEFRTLVEVQGRGFLRCLVKGQTVLSERRTVASQALRTLVEGQGPGFLLCSVSGQTVSELEEEAAASGPVR
jgi:hypothetical protein